MKMKLMIISVALLTVTTQALAQGARIKAGVNLANVSVSDNGRVEEANSITSFQVGLITDIPLVPGTLSFQPGILYTGKGSKTVIGSEEEEYYSKATTNPYYIEIPANLVFKAPIGSGAKLFAGAGPYLGIGIAGKTKIETTTRLLGYVKTEENIEFSDDDPSTLDYEEGAGFGIMKRFDYGLNGTAGIEGKSVVLSVNYGLGLAKLQSGSNSSDNNNNKHRVLSFTLGLKL